MGKAYLQNLLKPMSILIYIKIKPLVLTITDLNIANNVFDLKNTISMVTQSGLITPKQADTLLTELHDVANSHSFFSSLIFYMVTEVKH